MGSGYHTSIWRIHTFFSRRASSIAASLVIRHHLQVDAFREKQRRVGVCLSPRSAPAGASPAQNRLRGSRN